MRTSDDPTAAGATTGGFSIRRCLNTARDTFLTNTWGWLGYGVLAILFPPLFLRHGDSGGSSPTAEAVTGAVINGSVFTVLFALAYTVIIRAALRDTAGDGGAKDGKTGNAFPVLLLIGAAFLTVQAAAIHVAGLLGPEWALIDGPWYFRLRLTALIITAVSVLLLPFVLFAPFLCTAGATVRGSLARGLVMGRAHYLRLVALLLVCIGVITAGVLVLGVGIVVSVPVAILTVTAAYRQLTDRDASTGTRSRASAYTRKP
ncbi:hypothetical protein M0E82_07560 [Corynebacterium sp. P7202]|uniref:Uncharacterized protein n=1 Tax=Corynebacterium pygosceleis TaxID=2800406 RepID=A0A9Q4C8N3_9CORY|nr:hypothetical protein [Corynebacterium pygosceleis]MCK7637851.1 hypothetical protein [Corynebacterium pygosceleis]MCX7444609.1 hypothetical protein [Corynebacterium pygosceleis]MCX7468567.1 hypothetical protein [Corynebacterium pygosceleis]